MDLGFVVPAHRVVALVVGPQAGARVELLDVHDVDVGLVDGAQRAVARVGAHRRRAEDARHLDPVARLGHVDLGRVRGRGRGRVRVRGGIRVRGRGRGRGRGRVRVRRG